MEKNPDAYLLYEYMKKIAYTVRMKVTLDESVDGALLDQAAQEAIARLPYFSVRVELDEGENYVLAHNESPIPVLPEREARLVTGSDETSGHLFAITWRDSDIWFNFHHSVCGAHGALFWVKTTLYQYMTKRYGEVVPPRDLKHAGTPVAAAELSYPDARELPADEPTARYDGGNSSIGMDAFLKFIVNPLVRDNYYYEIEIPSDAFMDVATRIDASPSSLLAAMMLKTVERLFPRKKGQHLSVKIAADYRDDVSCPESYLDFVRFIHVKYDWNVEDLSIEQLNKRAREAIRQQRQPELSYECFRTVSAAHEGIDAQPNLKTKKKYAAEHSTFRTDVRDTCFVSYVGQQDWGGMADHMRSIYTVTDGNLMVELNALPDKFCISFQLLSKKPKAFNIFCGVLEEVGLPYKASNRLTRYLPDLSLPKR